MKQIPMTKGYVALVDDEDYDRVIQFKWYLQEKKNTAYAIRTDRTGGLKKTVRLHRFILNPADGMDVDHIDRNGLNCQRANMRICTRSQNAMNRNKHSNNHSGYKGVWFDKVDCVWKSSIMVNYKSIYLGSFHSAALAHQAYWKAAIKYHGEFANVGNSK